MKARRTGLARIEASCSPALRKRGGWVVQDGEVGSVAPSRARRGGGPHNAG